MPNLTKAGTASDQVREDTLRCFDCWRDPLRRYLICSGATPADADDAVQETFLRLYRHLENRGDRSNLCGWTFQVARNYLRDQRKRTRRHATVNLDELIRGESGIADPRGSPERRALDHERSRRLREAIEQLPEQQRECMLLRSSGLRYRDIAGILGIEASSARSVIHRAVAKLSEALS